MAGLVSSIGLARLGFSVALVEKKAYPFHRVCGEYVSDEVLPYLASIGADPAPLQPARISRFLVSAPSGKMLEATLDLGGWGLSRFTLDHFLYQVALQQGVQIYTRQQVEKVIFLNDVFTLQLADHRTLQAPVVLGSYGKRTTLDRSLNRTFFHKRSPYIGVKYHVRLPLPKDQIALHNFKDGYAGISAVEDDRYCLCYLTTRQNLRTHGTIPAMEKAILHQNPHLRRIFQEAEFLYEQPEVINEISFATKSCVENHMLMCGDAAGMIAPLCGNGMAMAIHSGKLATEQVQAYFSNGRNRAQLEQGYTRAWKNQFATRLHLGRAVQQLFGHPVLTELTIATLKHLPFAVQLLMRQTHGQPF